MSGMSTTIKLPGVVTEKLVYPDIDYLKLSCLLDPIVPAKEKFRQDTDIPYNLLEDAWKDCHDKLEYVRGLVDKWRKQQKPSEERVQQPT